MEAFGWALLALIIAVAAASFGIYFLVKNVKKAVKAQEEFLDSGDQTPFLLNGLKVVGTLLLFGALTVTSLIVFIVFLIMGLAALV